jgi:predicted dehydrogenase
MSARVTSSPIDRESADLLDPATYPAQVNAVLSLRIDMPVRDARRLRVGVLGCGQIAQAAHFESCAKARNADLYAICDVAPDLLERMSWTHKPERTFSTYEAMLADPAVEAVIVATSDAFHVDASIAALEAGKHVLCEKPLGIAIEETERLREAVKKSGRILQAGHMKRFDAGLEAAKAFIDAEMGEMLALKAWYCDSTHRYAMTDAVQPLIVTSANAKKPSGNPKADLRRYYMLAHGSHLVDTARYLGGEIVAVDSRLSEKFGAYCWFVDVEFANGALGHLDLTVAVRMDWHEGFQIYGQHGSILGKTYNPWYYKTSDVDIFRESTGETTRILGADGHFYRRQLEGFADTILNGAPMRGADVDDGIASARAMVAIARSVDSGKWVALADVSGAP